MSKLLNRIDIQRRVNSHFKALTCFIKLVLPAASLDDLQPGQDPLERRIIGNWQLTVGAAIANLHAVGDHYSVIVCAVRAGWAMARNRVESRRELSHLPVAWVVDMHDGWWG